MPSAGILVIMDGMFSNHLPSALKLMACCIVGGAALLAQSPSKSASDAKIDASAVWQVPPQFLATAHAACDAELSQVAECMIGQMQKAGAPASSIAFSRALFKQSHGEFGVLTGFQNESPVSFAWVTYPLRANTNYGLLLVNGTPAIVNVEDLKLLDRKTMEQSGQFQDTRNQFPKVDVWPGDRDGKEWPNSQPGPNGGKQFVVGYPLLNGCHACARAGQAIFTWNFDAKGRFLGTTFEGMTPPPL
ncbi:MAG TPA: hypothetical protein VKR59_02015 [Terriglobales bacterium]|nr:hypothetical protein [Terriglobales bacterium]